MTKLNAGQLRKSNPKEKDVMSVNRNPIYLILDRTIDTYNIGSLFRLADAVAAEKVYLCGDMEYPPSSKIHKAAVGTENWVPWVRYNSTSDAVKDLKKEGVQIIALEQSPKSINYSLLPGALRLPCAVIAGNETYGIEKEVLDLADIIVELPMYGVNKSFNVWGSTAVVCYKILEELNPKF